MAEQDADEIIEALEFLEGDDRYDYIIGLGKALPPMADALKTPATRVEGCMSQVWLVSRVDDSGAEPVLEFQGDSDAIIVKGLVAIVIALCSGKTPGQVLDLDLAGLFERVEMHKHLSGGRRSGLAAMVGRIKGLAEAYASAEPVT